MLQEIKKRPLDPNTSTLARPSAVKKSLFEYVLMAIVAIALIVCGIIFEQKFIKLLPTLISLLVMLMQSRVSRYAFLVAGINSALYSVGYIMERLYSSAASALLISFPLSITSFILWTKNQTKEKEVKVRRTNKKSGTLFIIASIVLWIGFYFIYKALGTKNLPLETSLFVLGLIITLMQMLRYIEAQYLNVFSYVLNIVQWTILTIENIANINYLIGMSYSLYCQIIAMYNWLRLYKVQHNTVQTQEQASEVEYENNAQ